MSNTEKNKVSNGMKKDIITLGGLPGSGKSSVKRILSEKLGYRSFSTGDFARELAGQHGMTIEDFNEKVAGEKSLDEEIDKELNRIEAEDNEMILDSHLAYHFVPSGFNVFLEVSLEVSAERIFNDKQSEIRQKSGDVMETYDEALARTKKRIDNHNVRYMSHYGVSPYTDKDQYDLIINTEDKNPQQVAELVLNAYNRWRNS